MEINLEGGIKLEKMLAEKSLFFFMEKIFRVDVDRWDDEFHWNMTYEEQNVRWCHNCKFFERKFDEYGEDLPLVDPEKTYCNAHKRRTKPFSNCSEYVSALTGEAGYDMAIRKMALYPRESLKTTIGVVGYILWCWIQDLDYTFLVLSQGEKHMKKVMRTIRRQLEHNPKIRQYWSELTDAYENATIADAYIIELDRPNINKIDPSLVVASIDSGQEGGHFDEILYDDVIGKKHANSMTLMDTAKSTYYGTLPLRIKKFPKQRYFATIQDDNDLTMELMSTGQWDVELWEVCYIRVYRGDQGKISAIEKDGKNYRQVTLEDCQRWIDNGVIDDELYIPYSQWFNHENILETIIEHQKDWNYLFTQYFNRPHGNPSVGFFKGWFQNMNEEEIIKKYYPILKNHKKVPWKHFSTYCMIDLATGKQDKRNKNSDNGYVVASADPFGNIFKRYNWIGKEDLDNAIKRIFYLNETYPEIEYFTIEKGGALLFMRPFFDKELEKKKLEWELKGLEYDEPQIFEVIRANAKKKARIISAWQPLYKNNKVIHVGSIHNWSTYVSQFLSIARKKPSDDTGLDGVDASTDMMKVLQEPDPEVFNAMLEEMVGKVEDFDEMQHMAQQNYDRMFEKANEETGENMIPYQSDIWS